LASQICSSESHGRIFVCAGHGRTVGFE